jgi:60 kDa SS-A/Ro ribonucleoprotein
MASLNKKPESLRTHEGAKAQRINPELELRRSVMACMLWENQFYEDGVEISDRIQHLCAKIPDDKLSEIAIEARDKQHLRHVPLFIAREMTRKGSKLVSETLQHIIQRPDELTEFLSLYWKDGKTPISAQVKKGLAKAFTKFNRYQLGKYNRDNAIKLRDVLFLSHAKPKDKEQASIWKDLVDSTFEVPDTWEVALSSGADKKETWTRLISEKKIGGLAILRNLRNMQEVKVERNVIRQAIAQMNTSRILPYRFIAASKYAPDYEPELESAMFKCLEDHGKFSGRTILLVDVSGSMDGALSSKSDLTRVDAACGLAMLLRETCNDVSIFTFSRNCVKVPNRRGFALAEAINHSQQRGSTCLGEALRLIDAQETYDRIIVITDEQSHDSVSAPKGNGYMINVASYQNGVGYGAWTHIDGFSESIVDYIMTYENF